VGLQKVIVGRRFLLLAGWRRRFRSLLLHLVLGGAEEKKRENKIKGHYFLLFQ
jgi:hypothetical protein